MSATSSPSSSRARLQAKNTLCVQLCRTLYRSVNGKAISNAYRNQLKLTSDRETTSDVSTAHLTYGEVVPESFIQILQLVASQSQHQLPTTFVDIGCGTGKAVIVAACCSAINFQKVWGIEIVTELVGAAKCVKDSLIQAIRGDGDALHSGRDVKRCEVGTKDGTLLEQSKTLLLNSNDKQLRIDHLASALCQNLGRKKYRQELKPFKSFQKFISEHSNQLSSVIDSSGVEWVKLEPALAKDNAINMKVAADATIDEETAGDGDGEREGNARVLSLDSKSRELLSSLPEIIFEEGDIFLIPWWESADVVYAASLLFSDEMMRQLTLRVSLMKPNSLFITLKPLHNIEEMQIVEEDLWKMSTSTRGKEFKVNTVSLISDSFFKMSWQMARVYIYRISEPL